MKMLVHYIIWSVCSWIFLTFLFTIFLALLIHKTRKIRSDVYLIEKLTLQILISSYFCFYLLYYLILENSSTDMDLIESINGKVLIPYLTGVTILHLLIACENISAFKDPTFTLRAYISKKAFSGYAELIMVLIISGIVYGQILLDESSDNLLFNHNSQNVYFYIFTLLLSILPVFFYYRIKASLSQYKVESKSKANQRNFADLIVNVSYLLCSVYLVVVSGLEKFTDVIPSELSYYLHVLFPYLILVSVLIDLCMNIYSICKSDFYYYTLANTKIGKVFRVFSGNYYRKPLLCSDFYFTNNYTKENSILYFHDNLSFLIEEHLLETSDHLINITLASLHKVFSIYAKSSQNIYEPPNTQKFRRERKSDIELNADDLRLANAQTDPKKILNDQDNIENFLLSDNLTTKPKVKVYEYFEFDFEDNNLIKLISLNSERTLNGGLNVTDELKITIKSFMAKEFEEVIIEARKINPKTLCASLISHLNQSGWNSLLGKNSREDYFKKQNKLILNTFDNLYNIEIVDENSIFYNDKDSEAFVDRYLHHMRANTSSFLPLILGVFKIKINSFKEFTVVLSKNLIIEENPQEFFNYWQLIRLSGDDRLQMVTSSKDRVSNIIKDDILFKSDFKLSLLDYDSFTDILTDDIKFLKRIKSKNFSLLVMYYELGKELNYSNFIDEPITRLSTPNIAALRISVISRVQPNNANNDANLKMLNSPNESSLLKDINLIRFKEQVGFKANYNNFKSVLYFVFDNVFDQYTSCNCGDYYRNYLNNILSYFEESNLLK